MALHVPKAPGFASMLKDGTRHYSGLEEAVSRNITACREFSKSLASAYGPNGMNKMIINHIGKMYVSNDAGTIIHELEVEHPAAKMVVLASQMMEQEIGDGTNFVIILAGALLKCAEELLRMGLKATEVAEGYELGLEQALLALETLSGQNVKDIGSAVAVRPVIRSAVMSKQYGNEDLLSELITTACISSHSGATAFNVDNVRVCKVLGGSLAMSSVISGMVFVKSIDSDVERIEGEGLGKIVVYTCPFDSATAETKGTVLIKTADELTAFSRGEECQLEAQVKAIADAGVKVIVSGGKIGDLALHYINKYKLMAVRLSSKWDIRRLCRAVRATPLPQVTTPTAEELGYSDMVYVDEMGDTPLVVFKHNSPSCRVSTIVVRGSTQNYLDDIERAINDGVNTYKSLCKDSRLVAGGGSVEVELSRKIAKYGEKCPGMEQYAVRKYAEALEVIPRTLAENSGFKPSEILSELLAAHAEGKVNFGLDASSTQKADSVVDCYDAGIIDLLILKIWGLKYATSAACTVLRVDQIIMAKRAGGPKMPPSGQMDAEDE